MARYETKSDAELVELNKAAMARLEGIWAEAERRADQLAGDDRTGAFAMFGAEAGEIKHMVHALHRKMDAWACRAAQVPVTRSGER